MCVSVDMGVRVSVFVPYSVCGQVSATVCVEAVCAVRTYVYY